MSSQKEGKREPITGQQLNQILALTLLAGSLSGCGVKNAPSGSQEQPKETGNTDTQSTYDLTAEENTIRFALPAGQVRTAIITIADELGYYEEEGINVEFVNSSGAELLGARSGLGFFVKKFSDYANYTQVIAGIILMGIVVTVLTILIEWVQRKAIKWRYT